VTVDIEIKRNDEVSKSGVIMRGVSSLQQWLRTFHRVTGETVSANRDRSDDGHDHCNTNSHQDERRHSAGLVLCLLEHFTAVRNGGIRCRALLHYVAALWWETSQAAACGGRLAVAGEEIRAHGIGSTCGHPLVDLALAGRIRRLALEIDVSETGLVRLTAA